MRLILIITFIISINLVKAQSGLSADDSLFFSKTLIIKLKPEYKNLQFVDGISSDELNYYLAKAQLAQINRIFPHHHSPEEKTNQYGDTLVDISLIYELKYLGEISEQVLISKLTEIGIFEYVERKSKDFLFFVPNDSLIANQYYPKRVKAFEAWDVETGDSNVVIGIVDTGTDLLGEDLKDGIKYNYLDPIDGIDNDNDGYIDNFMGWDLGSGDNNPSTYGNHHGCFAIGIAAARVNNGVGIAGMGYNTRYLPVKMIDENGYLAKPYEGIVYAADHGASIINNSWGGNEGSRFGQDIVNYATYNRNALVIGAAGNSANDVYIYPASYENVISCAATDSLDRHWAGTSYGTSVDISAPGSQVFSSWTANGYFASSGTSFSAPGVAGAAALVKSKYPNLSALQIGEQLRVTADNIDTISFNLALAEYLGSGRLNIYAALTDTVKPSIRFKERIIEAKSFMPTDTIKFSGEFENLLAQSSSSLSVTISSVSPYLSIVNPLKNLGVLSTLTSTNNYQSPFLLKISPNTPPGTIADIKFSYTDTNYSGIEYFRFSINPDFYNIDTNNITTTITSNGLIGYTSPSKTHGLGMYYKNSNNLLSWAGLVIGNSSGKVSSNIYGDNGFDQDFLLTQKIQSISPASIGDQEFTSGFNDDGAGATKLSISVDQQIYAYNQEPEDMVFMTYTITNNGNTPLSTLYIGFYADFDINASYKNKAAIDTNLRLAFTYSTEGSGPYAGLMLLDSLDLNIYQIDNDGSDNSVNIYDGFLDFEKFTTLSTNRDSAGISSSSGNDVSTMISAGPINLLPGNSTTITFGLLASDHIYGLKKAAQDAINVFYNVASIENENINMSVEVYPNPFDKKINIKFSENIKNKAFFEIYTIDGRMVFSNIIQPNTSQKIIDIPNLPSGNYFYKLVIDNQVINGNLIKI